MRVLVSGASGFVGSRVIGALLKAGHLVRGLTRVMPTQARERLGTEYIDDVDITRMSSLTPQLFEDVDAIVHLVGIIREGAGSQTFQWIHVEGTQNLMDAADSAGFRGRFVYVSALGAGAGAQSQYSRSKFAAEEIVRAGRDPFTIFRPSIILGKDSEFVQQMRDLVLHGGMPFPVPLPFIPIPGPGDCKFQPIAIGDLCACIVGCLALDDTAYKTYEVGGATQITFNEMVLAFAGRLGVAKPLVHVPIPALSLAAAAMETVLPKPPITRDQLINLGVDNTTSSLAIEEVFKVLPLSFEQILDLIFAQAP